MLFGLIFALVGWAVSEVFWNMRERNPLGQFYQFQQSIDYALKHGTITESNVERICDERLKDNKYWQAVKDKDNARFSVFEKQDQRELNIINMCWFIIIAGFIALGLAIAESVITKNFDMTIKNGTIGIVLGVVGGFVVSLFINKLYNLMLGADPGIAQQMLARSVGWGILGLFVAVAPGIVMKSINKLVLGLIGGLIGGLAGGLLFDPICQLGLPVQISRLVGIVGFGVGTAVATCLLENAAKQGWLKVVSGMITGKQFILYRNPTFIGSSPKCEIYLFKDTQVAAMHAAIHQHGGEFLIENLDRVGVTLVNQTPVTQHHLRNGDHICIGATQFVFESKLLKKQG